VLGGDLHSPGRHHGQLGEFADHGGQPAVAQALLDQQGQRLLVRRLGVDDPVWVQADLGERRGEQVRRPEAPEHRPRHPGQDSRDEQRGRRGVDDAQVPALGHLMHGPQRQPAAWQPIIDLSEPERQHAHVALPAAFQLTDAVA
jgi:hypothetical protein